MPTCKQLLMKVHSTLSFHCSFHSKPNLLEPLLQNIQTLGSGFLFALRAPNSLARKKEFHALI